MYLVIVMQEVLSKPGDRPLREQEYWTLELLDWTESYRPGFIVQQACGRWSEIDGQFMFENIETERQPLLIDAEARYEARRRELVNKGFVHSDMDLIGEHNPFGRACQALGKIMLPDS